MIDKQWSRTVPTLGMFAAPSTLNGVEERRGDQFLVAWRRPLLRAARGRCSAPAPLTTRDGARPPQRTRHARPHVLHLRERLLDRCVRLAGWLCAAARRHARRARECWMAEKVAACCTACCTLTQRSESRRNRCWSTHGCAGTPHGTTHCAARWTLACRRRDLRCARRMRRRPCMTSD